MIELLLIGVMAIAAYQMGRISGIAAMWNAIERAVNEVEKDKRDGIISRDQKDGE